MCSTIRAGRAQVFAAHLSNFWSDYTLFLVSGRLYYFNSHVCLIIILVYVCFHQSSQAEPEGKHTNTIAAVTENTRRNAGCLPEYRMSVHATTTDDTE